ncbi:DUF4129 domain-containing protein [Georgenia halophila]|uniref:DUF4129 domain-containing protein n=1 Tax=Georgenia halophila TaxID=620889 RepID=A0ABP8L0P1_9MICO
MTGVRAGVPVEPDAAEAQRWAEEELAKAVYDNQPGLIERILEWLGRLLSDIGSMGMEAPPAFVPLVVVLAFVVVVVVSLLLGGRVRARRTAQRQDSHQLFDDVRDSAALLAAADDAARRGDWVTATLERFRALVRSLDERAVLEDRAGLTAYEAATLAAAALPDHTDGLRWAGRLFDDVCYGHLAPGQAEDRQLRELASAVSRARPARHDDHRPVGAGWAEVR